MNFKPSISMIPFWQKMFFIVYEFMDMTSNTGFIFFEFTKQFVNATPGSNFSFGLGLGIGLEIRNASGRVISVSQQVSLRVTRYELEFLGKERNKDVTS